VRGSYFESCNCDAICPCRRIDGRPGGRSTHGVCMGVLSWLVAEGGVGPVDLAGLAVALAVSYDDDEPGSPWSFVLYVDERGDDDQREALEAVFLGRLGGSAVTHFPWAWKASRLVAVRVARIEVGHTRRRQWLRVADHVEVRIAGPAGAGHTVTCVIPGHDRSGKKLETGLLRVGDAEPVSFEFRGTCGYASDFDYGSEEQG
jgi:hypothetical protein